MTVNRKFDITELRRAVESAPDFPAARAEVDRTYALKRIADREFSVASERVGAIWDREADRLYGMRDDETVEEYDETDRSTTDRPENP